jgi:hypothetical protein
VPVVPPRWLIKKAWDNSLFVTEVPRSTHTQNKLSPRHGVSISLSPVCLKIRGFQLQVLANANSLISFQMYKSLLILLLLALCIPF